MSDYFEPKPFKLITASAGTGKTFILAQNFVELCVINWENPLYYQSILCLTFTNKARDEMVNRISLIMKELGNDREVSKNSGLVKKYLIDELELSEEEVTRRAKYIWDYIHLSPDAYSIMTIDEFFSKVFRGSYRDLGFEENYTLIIDAKKIYTKAVDLLFDSLTEEGNPKDYVLQTILYKFIENEDEEESKNIRQILIDKYDSIFNEVNIKYYLQLSRLPLTDFQDAISTVRKILKESKTLTSNVLEVKSEISTSTFLTWVKKGIEKAPESKAAQEIVAEERKVDTSTVEAENAVKTLMQFYHVHKNYLSFLKEIDSQLNFNALFSLLLRKTLQLCIEENTLPVSLQQLLLKNAFDSGNIPESYINLSKKYKNIFIDEFQDTSIAQWRILWPIFTNALGEGNRCLIVGDAKQAIYRWRGGEVNLFTDLPFIKHPEISPDPTLNNVLTNLTEKKVMQKSYRSNKTIISFVNHLVSKIVLRANLAEYGRKAYDDFAMESASSEEDGLVRLVNFNGDITINDSTKFVLESIQDCLNNNIDPNEIYILSRTNNELIAWSSAINSNAFLLDSKSIRINSYVLNDKKYSDCRSILLFVNFIELQLGVNTHYISIVIQSLLSEILKQSQDESPTSVSDSSQAFFRRLTTETEPYIQGTTEFYKKLIRMITEAIVHNDEESFYFSHLIQNMNETSLLELTYTEFITIWRDQIAELPISLYKPANSIMLATIFKAKGLENECVILPNLSMNYSKNHNFWFGPKHPLHPVSQIPYFNLNVNKIEKNGAFQTVFTEELQRITFDALNIIYVAITRAKSRLYMLVSSMESIGLDSSFIISEDIENTELINLNV